jgi:hypothetical protein
MGKPFRKHFVSKQKTLETIFVVLWFEVTIANSKEKVSGKILWIKILSYKTKSGFGV